MSKTYRISTPDGKIIQVEGPEDATDDELVAFARSQIGAEYANDPVVKGPDVKAPVDDSNLLGFGVDDGSQKARPNIQSLIMQGLTFGGMDEIMGGANAIGNAVASPFMSSVDFDPSGAYNRGRDAENAVVEKTRQAHPWLSAGSELLGSLLTGGAAVAGPRSLLGATKAAAKTGAIGGAAYGFNTGDGINNRLAGAGIGGLAGGAFGAALPTLFNAASRPVQAAVNYLRPDSGLGGQLVARSLLQDGISPRNAGAAMDAARARGVPLTLADLGENTRGLAGAVSRQPGRARTLAREAVTTRQAEQGERVQSALERDLGPTGYVPQMSDDLRAQARAAAGPLYDKAYAAPAISSPELESILATPAGKQALARARTIAANERKDPSKLGFALDADGGVVLSPDMTIAPTGEVVREAQRAPAYTPETLDYVKRGLDDVLESRRDIVTRRLPTDEDTRAVSGVRQSFVSELDRLNPDYKAARAAYQGPARAAQSLEVGRKAIGASADDIARMTNGMSDVDRAQFALGHRSALSEMLAKRVDGSNKAAALVGSPRKRDALAEAYGSTGNVPRFGQTLDDENAAYQTYHAITGGSPTANRLADDASIADGALLQDVTGSVIKGVANGGITGGIAELLGRARDVGKFGAGKTGERARESAGSLLFEQSPTAVADALRNARQIELQQRVARLRANQRLVETASLLGRGVGGAAAYGARPVE